MTDSLQNPERRKFLKTLGASGALALGAGCSTLAGLRDDAEGVVGGGEEPPTASPPTTTATTTEETTTATTEETTTTTEESTTTEEPENTFAELDSQMEKVETDSSLKHDLSYTFDGESLKLHKEMLEEGTVEDKENWGVYARIEVTDYNNWDDIDGIYKSGEEGKELLKDRFSEGGWQIFQTLNRYAGDLIKRDRINLDSVTEIGMIFYDDEGETAGYIADKEDLDEIYGADSLEKAYKNHFEEEFALSPREEEK